MTINSAQIQVSTAPVLLGSGGGNGITISVYNATGTAAFLTGGTATAATAGYQLAGSASLNPLVIERGDSLYALTSSGTTTLHVLRGGV